MEPLFDNCSWFVIWRTIVVKEIQSHDCTATYCHMLGETIINVKNCIKRLYKKNKACNKTYTQARKHGTWWTGENHSVNTSREQKFCSVSNFKKCQNRRQIITLPTLSVVETITANLPRVRDAHARVYLQLAV